MASPTRPDRGRNNGQPWSSGTPKLLLGFALAAIIGLTLVVGATWFFLGRGAPPVAQQPAPVAPDDNTPPAAPNNEPPTNPARLDVAPPKLTAEKVVKLPDVARQIVPAADGRLLILHYPRLRRLDVFDTAAVRVVRSIELAEEQVHIAAGMTKMLVSLPSAGLIQRYDLATGQRELVTPFPVRHITAFVLGHASTGPLLVAGERGVRLYDIITLRELELPTEPDDRPPEEQRLFPAFRPAPQDRTLPFQMTSGYFRATRNSRVFIAQDYAREPEAVAIGPDRIVRANENRDGTWVIDPLTNNRPNPEPNLFANLGLRSALHGPFHLQFQAGGLSFAVCRDGDPKPIAEVKHPAVVVDNPPWPGSLAYSTWMNLIPQAGVLVLLDGGGDRLRVIPFDVDQAVTKAGAELFVTSAAPAEFQPGERLRYPVRVVSKAGGVTYSLKSGPDGMTVDRDGVVTWTPPRGFNKPVSAVLTLLDTGGKQIEHLFTVVPEGAAESGRLPTPIPDMSAGPLQFPPPPPRLPIQPPKLAGRTVVTLPADVGRVLPAGGGRFLVLHFPTLKQVGVFDVTEARIVRTIDVPDDKPLLAAGMTKLVAYLPSSGKVQRFDLTTGKSDGEKKLSLAGVRAIGLGHASAGPLLVTNGDGGRLFDLDTLAELPIPPDDDPNLGLPPGEGPRIFRMPDYAVAVSANGRLFVGSRVISVRGGRVIAFGHPGPAYTFGPPRPSPDGRYLFGQPGSVSSDGRLSSDVISVTETGAGAVPAVEGQHYMVMNATTFTLYRYGMSMPIARLVDLGEWGKKVPPLSGKQPLPDTDRFHLIPRANLVVAVGPGSDRLLLAPVDLAGAEDALGDELGTDLLMVTSSPPTTFCPGTEFRYQLRAKSRAGGVAFNLIAGPVGMTVGPDGLVRWNAPSARLINLPIPIGFGSVRPGSVVARIPTVPGEVSVIVGLIDATGKEAVQRFTLNRTDRPEEYTADLAPVALPPRQAAVPTPGPRSAYRLPPPPPAFDMTNPALTARTEVAMPGKITAVVPAGAGRFLVLHVKSARKALVFDACSATVTQTIDLGDPNAIVTAGATHLMVYRRVDDTIEKYDLMTGVGGGRKPIPTRGVTDLVMGSASAGPVFVRAGLQAELYDVETLTPIELPRVVPGGADTFPFRQGRVWVSPDGRTFGNVVDRPTGPVARVANLGPDGIEFGSTILPRLPFYLLSDEQRQHYLGGYRVDGIMNNLMNRSKLPPGLLENYTGPDLYLQACSAPYRLVVHSGRLPGTTKNGVSIHRTGQAQRVAVVEIPEITGDRGRGLGLEEAVHLFPWSSLLAVVPPAADRLVLYPVNLGEFADIDRPPLRWRLPDVPPAPVVKPTVLRERKVIEMGPYEMGRIAAGGGGRYLVCQDRTSLRIIIIDVTAGKVVGAVPSGQAFTVGMSKLVVLGSGPYLIPALLRYDLATGKLEASVAIPSLSLAVAMGSASAGPVVTIGRNGIEFYDLTTLQRLQPPEGSGKWQLDPQRLAASADGRTFVVERMFSANPPGPIIITLEKDRIRYTARNGPRRVWSAGASADGHRVFLGGVGVFAGDLQTAADVVWSPKELGNETEQGLTFVPAVDGPYYLHVHLGKRAIDPRFATDPEFGVTVYRYGDPAPKGQIPGAFGPLPKRVGNIPWEIEQRDPGEVAFLFSAAKVLATVNMSRREILLTPLDPEAIPPATEPPKPGPKPGSKTP